MCFDSQTARGRKRGLSGNKLHVAVIVVQVVYALLVFRGTGKGGRVG